MTEFLFTLPKMKINRDGDIEEVSPTELREYEKQIHEQYHNFITQLQTRINELELEVKEFRNLKQQVKELGETPWVTHAKKTT